jgi:hypothetical protein
MPIDRREQLTFRTEERDNDTPKQEEMVQEQEKMIRERVEMAQEQGEIIQEHSFTVLPHCTVSFYRESLASTRNAAGLSCSFHPLLIA